MNVYIIYIITYDSLIYIFENTCNVYLYLNKTMKKQFDHDEAWKYWKIHKFTVFKSFLKLIEISLNLLKIVKPYVVQLFPHIFYSLQGFLSS